MDVTEYESSGFLKNSTRFRARVPFQTQQDCEYLNRVSEALEEYFEEHERPVAAQKSPADVDDKSWLNAVRTESAHIRRARDDCPDSKGKTPKRRRVLFATTLKSFNMHMDRWFYDLYTDASNFPDWETYIWGPGFPLYDEKLTLENNLLTRFPDNPEFDAIFFMYTIINHPGTGISARLMSYQTTTLPGRPMTACLQHEMTAGPEKVPDGLRELCGHAAIHFFTYVCYIREQQAGKWIPRSNTTLVRLMPEGNPSFMLKGRIENQIADCEVPDEAWDGKWNRESRKQDFLLAGSLEKTYYPLRNRVWSELVDRGQGKLTSPVVVYKHPGWTELKDVNDRKKQCVFRIDTALPQHQRFFDAFKNSKICIVGRCEWPLTGSDGRLYHAIRKYSEAMGAGCLIAGDLPDNEDVAQHVAVRLDANMTREEMTTILNQALQDYNAGLYDGHLRRAYCAAKQKYNYLSHVEHYLEPGFREFETKFKRPRVA